MIDAAELTLEDLSQIVRISPARCEAFIEACKVCLHEQKHASGVRMRVDGMSPRSYVLRWEMTIGQAELDSWADSDEATEDGACAIACLIIHELVDKKVVRRSRKKTGVDYWLAHMDDVLFQDAGRMEVSGIRADTPTRVRERVARKLKQTMQSDATHPDIPAYVVVVEFGTPVSHVEMRRA